MGLENNHDPTSIADLIDIEKSAKPNVYRIHFHL